jgi:hypothetical protein
MEDSTNEFIGDLTSSCVAKKITLQLVAKPSVRADGFKCSGFFDGTRLVVATGGTDWLSILVHESSHMDQCVEESPWWADLNPHISEVHNWLGDRKHRIKNKHEAFRGVVGIELDAERRSLRKIRRYNLPIDQKLYVKKANSYLFSYTQALRSRSWFPQPYTYPEIWERMPSRFFPLEDYLDPKSKFIRYYDFSLLKNGSTP